MEEFCKVVTVKHLSFPSEDVLVVWNWDWLTLLPSNAVLPTQVSSLASTPMCATPDITTSIKHTLRFKCIRSTKELRYQEALADISLKLKNGDVPVDLFLEPNNPFDAKAIAFKCEIGGSWKKIGYIVKEALDEVHKALKSNLVLSVKFGWVKFKMNWYKSGFGWYAGIDITKIGEWSSSTCMCASK